MAITTDILSLPVAVSIDGTEWTPIVQGTGGSAVTRRVTTGLIANTATGFVPDTAVINAGIGLTGGGPLTSDPTLSVNINELTALPAMAIADSFAVNAAADGNLVRKVTFPNAMKAISGLTALPFPNLTNDFLVIVRGSDKLTYKVSPSALSLAAGNVPAGGLTGQSLVKTSNADYDTEWSTGGFINQVANVVFSGPASGAATAPAFRALVGADLPNPAASTKGGVYSYAAVSNQFLTQIGTDGSVSSAQPAFSNISGTATVAQGGTGLTTGASGGILGYTASGTLASSVALTANAIVLGGGAGATPTPMASLGTTTTVLHGNAAGAPTFGPVSLTADVSGTLPVANGGTGNTALAALTKSDDTNVTLTLGGSPTTALVNAASLTLGWTGTLSISRGGIGVGTLAANGVLLGNGTSAISATAVGTTGQILAGNTASAPTWQGVSAVIDNLGATQGQILYRNASAWVPLAPGTSGQVLQTGGAGANPSWTSVGGTGTVTSINASGGTTGMSFSGGPVTTSGTLTLSGTLAVANGGTGITSFGTGVATALGINVGSAGAFVTFNGALGTPSSGTLTNCTGLPVAGGGTGLSSATAYAVLCGGTTSTAALQSIASVGTAGHVLTSNGAGALPTFQVATGGVSSLTASNGVTTSTGSAITSTGTLYGSPSGAGGRITLTTGTPVLTTTVSAATTIYYTPYAYNLVPIYDGTVARMVTFTELSVVLGSNWAANTNFDVFYGNDGGTFRLCTVAWTNATTRATALNLSQYGFYTNNASFTARYNNTTTFTCPQYQGTYLGTIRTNASTGQVDFNIGASAAGGTAGFIGLWNNYNRVGWAANPQDSTASWTYATAAWRAADASNSMRVSFVCGFNEEIVDAVYGGVCNVSSSGGGYGIGYDSTSALATGSFPGAALVQGTSSATGLFAGASGLGFHYVQALEYGGTDMIFYGIQTAGRTFAGLQVKGKF